MKIKYITIEREYGSGGTEIAEKVAEKCGIPCYGAEIMEKAAEKLHISVEEAQRYEEKITSSFLYSMFVMGQVQSGNINSLPMESKLYVEEHNAICSFAKKGRGVFVGHCASEALKEESGVLRVFIRASNDFKRDRVVSEYGIPEKDADVTCRWFDKKRSTYYTFNTSKKWDDAANYDMVLDSSTLGIDGCVDAIAALLHHE